MTLDCKTVRDILSAFVDDELDTAAAEAVGRHVNACVDCQAELAAMRSLLMLLPSSEVEPPSDLRTRIVRATVCAPTSTPLRFAHGVIAAFTPRYVRYASAAAMTALAVMFVSTTGQQPSDSGRRITQPRPAVQKARISSPTVTTARKEAPVDKVVEGNVSPETVPVVVTARMPEKKIQRPPSTKLPAPKQPLALPSESPAPSSETIEASPARSDEPATTPVVVRPFSEETKDIQVSGLPVADNKKTEGTPPPAPKVNLAAGEQMVTPDDEQEMIRSIKKQLRMQKKGDGIYVDVVDINF